MTRGLTEEEEAKYWSQRPARLTYQVWDETLPEIIASRPLDVKFGNGSSKETERLKFKSKSCGRKSRYETEEKAHQYLHGDMHTYQCKFCGFWHIGHGRKNYGKIYKTLSR